VDSHKDSRSSILVTGATGFVGINVVRHLAESGESVVGHDLEPPNPLVERFLEGVRGRVTFVTGDLTDRVALAALFDRHGPKEVIHAGVITSTPETERAIPGRVIEVNVLGTTNMLELARESGCRRFIYVSSSGVYGSSMPGHRLRETAPLELSSLYRVTKHSSELLVGRYRAIFGLEAVSVRLSAPYGPMERPTGTRVLMSPIFHLAQAVLTKRPPVVRGLRFGLDWTYVEDIARALGLLIKAPRLTFDLYNVSSGRTVLLTDVIAVIARLEPGFHARPARSAKRVDISLTRNHVRAPLSIARLRRDIQFKPAYPLARGLATYFNFLRQMAAEDLATS
jgi:UDP-glucose 4-epimerase